jgi:hypothetical protein
MRLATGPTGPSAGASGEPASDNAELDRLLRGLLRRQPQDVGLVVRTARALSSGKARGKAGLRERMEAALKSLGDQFLPPDGL